MEGDLRGIPTDAIKANNLTIQTNVIKGTTLIGIEGYFS